MATYTGDKKEYKAVVEELKQGYYLVRYVDFGEEKEWLPISSIKKL